MTVYLVEEGSDYSSDPWNIVGVFEDEQDALNYKNQQDWPSLIHITEVPFIKKKESDEEEVSFPPEYDEQGSEGNYRSNPSGWC